MIVPLKDENVLEMTVRNDWNILDFVNKKLGFAKTVIIKSQRQFIYDSNLYGSDVRQSYSIFLPILV